jgi:hypothetical protein
MQNYFTIEFEVETRKQERERTAAADARAAQASSSRRGWSWFARTFRSQASLLAMDSSRTPVSALLELPRVPRPVAC